MNISPSRLPPLPGARKSSLNRNNYEVSKRESEHDEEVKEKEPEFSGDLALGSAIAAYK